MSENEHEIAEAAAVGAAAAVSAVQDEHHEDERHDAMETATAVAGESAQLAGEQAESAAAAATAAAAAASEAQSESLQAEAVAQQAAAEAETAQSDVDSLRDHIASGFTELRKFITESLAPKQPDTQPTEVTVTHGTSGQDSGENRSDERGSGSAGESADKPYRHRFGRRIP